MLLISVLPFYRYGNYDIPLLYDYETLSLALREGHVLGVSENRMLRIFHPEGKKKEENRMIRSYIVLTDCGILQVLPTQGR
jgi:hypothetical protein